MYFHKRQDTDQQSGYGLVKNSSVPRNWFIGFLSLQADVGIRAYFPTAHTGVNNT
jgi:hypothetical protein